MEGEYVLLPAFADRVSAADPSHVRELKTMLHILLPAFADRVSEADFLFVSVQQTIFDNWQTM